MLGLDLSETKTVEVAGGEWVVGALPWGKLEALRHALTEAHARQGEAAKAWREALEDDAARVAFEAAHAGYLDACAEVVRWGIRGTPSPMLDAVPHVGEAFAGGECRTLSPVVIEALRRVQTPTGETELFDQLAFAVLKANTVDAADLLGFK